MFKMDYREQMMLGRKGSTMGVFLQLGIVVGAFLLGQVSLSTRAIAQDIYPANDITLIVHAAAGGSFDLGARGMAPFLSKYFKEGTPKPKGGDVKIKSMTAAGGAKACEYLYNIAKPDGYTIGTFNRGNLYKFLYGAEKLPFDVKNLTWLFSPALVTRVLICNKKKFSTWEEMLASAKKEPLSIVTSIVGGSDHIESIYLKETVGIPGKITATGGIAPSVAAVLRGDGDISVVAYDAVKAMIESKEINVLVTFTGERIIPQVPTIGEKGFPLLAECIGGKGGQTIVAPPNLPPNIKGKIISVARNMIADPGYQAWAKTVSYVMRPLFDTDLKDELIKQVNFQLKWEPVLKRYGL